MNAVLKSLILFYILLLPLSYASGTQVQEIRIDALAPEFSLMAEDGKKYSLSDFKGKEVVFEWYNFGCPFVRKHYDSKNMQNIQKKYTNQNVVWLKIVSSAPGKQGYLKGSEEARLKEKEEGSHATHILLDPNGVVGQLYGAVTTPHMYIVNKKGLLVYNGAIDSVRSVDRTDIPKAHNYIRAALDSIKSNKKIKVKKNRPYGCSVKY